MQTIHVFVSGVAGAGSTTVAKAIADSIKPVFKGSRVYNADQDESPESQPDRLAAIADKLNIIIDTRQETSTKIDYTSAVKDFVERVFKVYGNDVNWNSAPVKTIVEMVSLANAVGLEDVDSNFTSPAYLFKQLKDWLTKPQEVESLEKRQKDAGEIPQNRPFRRRRNI